MQVSRAVRRVDRVSRCRPLRLTHYEKQRGSRRLLSTRGSIRRPNRFSKQATLILNATDPENQTVVEEEGEMTENLEETETETPKEEGEGEGEGEMEYTGLGMEALQKLKESEDYEGIAEELEAALRTLCDEKTAAEGESVTLEAELEETKNKFLRLTADFENFRKRADTEREKLRTTTKGDVIESLLPLIDNFELARTQIRPQNESEEAIVNSFMGLYRQMVELFNQMGVEAIDCDQKPFDPEFHDAIMREPNDDLPDGTVIEELRKGFMIKGNLLRPAMVKVSYSEALQDAELPMEESEGTIDLDADEEETSEETTEETSD